MTSETGEEAQAHDWSSCPCGRTKVRNDQPFGLLCATSPMDPTDVGCGGIARPARIGGPT